MGVLALLALLNAVTASPLTVDVGVNVDIHPQPPSCSKFVLHNSAERECESDKDCAKGCPKRHNGVCYPRITDESCEDKECKSDEDCCEEFPACKYYISYPQ